MLCKNFKIKFTMMWDKFSDTLCSCEFSLCAPFHARTNHLLAIHNILPFFFFILYYFILFALPNICCVFLRNENHNWKWFCYGVWNEKRSSFCFFISRLEFWLNDFPKFGTMPFSSGQLLPTTLIIISTENVRIPCKFESTNSINECYVWSNERCITRKRSFILLILYTENIN